MTYFGRLDPLAEGVLIVASGTDIRSRDVHLSFGKEYEFSAILGISTDTYDILGKITKTRKADDFSETRLRSVAKIYSGKREQEYPPYSSKPVKGKPLFRWAREGKISKIEIPTKEIEVHSLKVGKVEEIPIKQLYGRIFSDILKVKGDFRQDEILEIWRQFSKQNKGKTFVIVHYTADVSSGTYVRSLVHEMGKTLGYGACTLSIKRTRVGEYTIEDSIK